MDFTVKIKSSAFKPRTIEIPVVWNKIYGKAHAGYHDRLEFKISTVEKFKKIAQNKEHRLHMTNQTALQKKNLSNSYFMLHKASILR